MNTLLKRTAVWGLGAVGAGLVLVAIWQIAGAGQGLQITEVRSTPPMTIIVPAGAAPGTRPLVLIAHGYAGSALIMRGFAFSLAHAGYATISWDFNGHGANPRSPQAEPLLANAQAALAEARARGLLAGGRFVILGHSMGTGVALQFGQVYPDTAATIAVSPVGQTVTTALPRNLLLMAGSLEAPFVRNAERRLAEAGGSGGDPRLGTARKMTVIPNVEHISILFAPAAHAEAVAWLDAAFGPQPGAAPYTDLRMLWYGLGMLGVLLLAAALAPLVWRGERAAPSSGPGSGVEGQPGSGQKGRPLWWRVAAVAAGGLAATLLLQAASASGLALRTSFGLQIGGYLMVWFAVAGVCGLLLLWRKLTLPSRRALAGGGLAFAALWLGLGLLGQSVWFPWLLIWERLRFWPVAFLLLLPWSLLVAQVSSGAGLLAQVGRWVVHSLVLLASLYLAMQLSPDLGFLSLILPAFPIILALHAVAAAPQLGAWPFALSGAAFYGWVLLAIFPLA